MVAACGGFLKLQYKGVVLLDDRQLNGLKMLDVNPAIKKCINNEENNICQGVSYQGEPSE